MASSGETAASEFASRPGGWGARAFELCLIGIAYFVLAKLGLMVASIHPSATPIWPATGLALAAVLLRGYRVAPAILIAAFAANATTVGTLATSAVIGAGDMLEGLLGAWLLQRWSGGRRTFTTAAGVARFALIACFPALLSATLGVATLELAGFADWSKLGSIWLTWWLGDLTGTLVITPVIVLWSEVDWRFFRRQDLFDSLVLYAATCVIGLVVFSPLIEQSARRQPLAFLAILPLLWSALRRGQRDTATVALTLSAFAVWGTLSSSGPFGQETLNESFLLLLMFIISTAVPSLVLSADAVVRRRTEEELRRTQDNLNQQVDSRTAALRATNLALQDEIEHRKRVEAQLEEQRVFLLEGQRLAHLGTWVRDMRADKLTWSEQMHEIFGIPPGEEPPGTFERYLAMIHPEEREHVREEVSRAIANGEGFRAERRIVRPDGQMRHLQTSVEFIKDENGRVIRMHGVCLDVTERKTAQIALERTREQLAQAQKMEAIGQLTGGIAHDFNNLLMIVGGHAEMLRRRVSEPKALQGIEAIATAARRGESLTRQLLTFSRKQPLNPIAVDLRMRIEAIRPMLGSSLRGNITLNIEIPSDIWPVEVDVVELELAIVNIAVNARDAMPQGGAFAISARNVEVPDGQPCADLGIDHVRISFTDSGAGIAPELIRKIFDPFFTTKAVGKGTGLGLSQVYGFAAQSHGAVNVQSELGRGTSVILCLPRSRAALSVAAPETSGGASRMTMGEGTVLVVEDNPEVGSVTATLLEQIGYRVVRAETAAEALARLQNDDAIDVLLSDIVMPNGMNGIHLAQEVSERYPHIGVLLTTGYSDVAATAEARFPILRKPFELQALERAVRDALKGAAGVTHPKARGSAA